MSHFINGNQQDGTTSVSRMRATSEIRAGCVWVDDHLPIISEIPHGGLKQSGFGEDMSSIRSTSTPSSST